MFTYDLTRHSTDTSTSIEDIPTKLQHDPMLDKIEKSPISTVFGTGKLQLK